MVAGFAIPEPAPADGPLNCKGRAATVIAIPGVRSVGTPGADVIIGFPLVRDTLDGRAGNDLMCGLGRGTFSMAAAVTTSCAVIEGATF
ncbi:MAG: hypothetical protein ACR2IN_11180 [Thermoleophilaceae bacterium]